MNSHLKLENTAIMHSNMKLGKPAIMKPKNTTITHSNMKLGKAAIMNNILKPENTTITHSKMKLDKADEEHPISWLEPGNVAKTLGNKQAPNHINSTRTGNNKLTPTSMAPTPNWTLPPTNESSLSSTLHQDNDTTLTWPFNSSTNHQQGYYHALTMSPDSFNSTQSTYATALDGDQSYLELEQESSESSQESCIFTSLLKWPVSAPPNAPTSPAIKVIATLGAAGWSDAADSHQPHQWQASNTTTPYEHQTGM
jgi:hypothetical protein